MSLEDIITHTDDIATLTNAEGEVSLLDVYKTVGHGDCALVPLGANGSLPPAMTVNETEQGILIALYHETSPQDAVRVDAEWCRNGADRYCRILVPEGTITLAAYLIVGET